MPAFRYCPRCGQALPPPEVEARLLFQKCPSCSAVHYRNAKPTASALVVADGRVLLGRRGIEPFKGEWDVPGGFLEPWEHPEEGAVREIAEETGLVVRPKELIGVYVDTYGAGGDYTLNFYYVVEIVSGEPVAADDVAELRFFAPEELPERVAFENGRQALAEWKRRVSDQPSAPEAGPDFCAVRECQSADLPSVVALSELWASEGVTHGQEAAPLDHFSARLGQYFWVAESDSRVIGFAYGSVRISDGLAVIPKGESYLEIDEVYVHPDLRDRRVGGRLVDALLAEAAANGVSRSLVYSATKDWRRIVDFYESHGFGMWCVQMYR